MTQRQKIFAVRDSKAETFGQPIFAPTKGSAVRSFSEACNTPGHDLNKWPEDFCLFELGEYDEREGLFYPLPCPVSVGLAAMFVVNDGVKALKVAP